jgi:vancomycin resistance protein VanW
MKVLVFILVLLCPGPQALAAAGVYDQLWGGSATSLAGRSGEQRANAGRASLDLNGVIIAPGAVFSFNEHVGARDPMKGYQPAPIITAAGDLADSAGGGICQLATTIYNAALEAGLEISERHPHSRRVGYVPLGRDATILTWRKDLKLRNPHAVPVQLRLAVNARQVTAAFWSVIHKPFRVIINSERVAHDPEAAVSPGGQAGEIVQNGSSGFSVITRRTIVRDGSAAEQILSEDFYPAPSTLLGGALP